MEMSLLPITVSNKALQEQLTIVLDSYKDGLKATMRMAQALTEIKDKELYKDDFKKFEDVADAIGIKRAQAFNLVKGYRIYAKYNLPVDFNNTKCIEIARLENKLGEEEVKQALECNEIKPSMTRDEIRNYVDKRLGVEKPEKEKPEQAKQEKPEQDEKPKREVAFIVAIGTDDKGYYIVNKAGLEKRMKKKDFEVIQEIFNRIK